MAVGIRVMAWHRIITSDLHVPVTKSVMSSIVIIN